MPTLKRIIRVTITDSRDNILAAIEDVKIDFNIDLMVGAGLDSGTISIYNMNHDTVKAIMATGDKRVKLEVGHSYTGDVRELFTGDITNIHAQQMYENHITTLYCWSRLETPLGLKLNTTTFRNQNLRSIIESIASEADIPVDFSRYIEAELNSPLVSYKNKVVTFEGTRKEALEYLGEQHNFKINTTGGVLRIIRMQKTVRDLERIIKERERLNLRPVVINEERIRKPPVIGFATAKINYLLSPEIIPSDILEVPLSLPVDISDFRRTLYFNEGVLRYAPGGSYMIYKISHVGSNFEDDWDTTLAGFKYSNLEGLGEQDG